VLVLGLSAITVRAMYLGGLKQQWREMAAEAANESRGKLLVTYPTLAGVLIDTYQPGVLRGNYLNISDGGDLPDLSQPSGTRPGELWLSYMEVLFIQKIRDQLQAQGYQQVSHKYFPAHHPRPSSLTRAPTATTIQLSNQPPFPPFRACGYSPAKLRKKPHPSPHYSLFLPTRIKHSLKLPVQQSAYPTANGKVPSEISLVSEAELP
jgi:hypothetical protein